MSSRRVAGALFVFGVSLTLFQIQSGDVLMYLSLARDFIFGAFSGDADPYLYSLPHATLVWTHQWASYVVFYGAWLTAGAAGLIALKAILLSAIFWLVLSDDEDQPLGLWPGLWMIGITAASFRFVERGSLFSDLALVLLVRWLLTAPTLTRALITRLTILFLLWAQVHPGYPLGFALLGIWAVHRRAWSAWLALPILAPLLNPAFARGYLYPFRFAVNEAQTLKHFNYEWFPSYHPAFRFAPETIAYWIFAFVSVVVIARARRPRDLRTWFAVFSLSIGAGAVRFIPFAVFSTLMCVRPWTAFASLRIAPWLARIGIALTLALALKNVALGYESSSGRRKPGFAFDAAYFPTTNLEILRHQSIPGRLYATQDFGATLIWNRLTPIFDHGFVTDMAFYRDEVVGTLNSPEVFFRLAQTYGWTMLLVEKRNAYRSFYAFLKDRPEWRIVGEDAASYLIFRQP